MGLIGGNMKTEKSLILIAVLCFAVLGLSACNTDDSAGQGSVKISFENSNARYAVSESEKSEMIYTITFTSPGKDPVIKTTEKGAASVTISVPEGNWDIDVQAEGNRILGSGEANITVIAGSPVSKTIKMKIVGTRVYNWGELCDDLLLVKDFQGNTLQEYSIEIVNDLTADTNLTLNNNSTKKINLWAKKLVIIKRGDAMNQPVFIINSGALIMDGSKGGEIIILGNHKDNTALINVTTNAATSGTLIMRNGVTIKGNTSAPSGLPSNLQGQYGGGVYVGGNGIFIMEGGIISGNYASSRGGGVYVENGGTFTKTGGTIYGGNAGDNSNRAGNGTGNGNAVYFVSGNSIDGNY
jgi:predicted small secreted protein